MSYSIVYRNDGVDYYHETRDDLEDARQVYERAIEEIEDAESIKLVDSNSDTIEEHVF